jgi:DNA-binding NarL/FixJ family response regulator
VSLLDRVGLPEKALQAAREGFALTERFGVARTYGALLLGFAAKAQHAIGAWDDADRTTTDGLRLRPSGRAELWLLVNRGRLLACRGSFDEAAALLRRAREIDARLGPTEFRTPLLAALAELAVWSGRPEDAREHVAEGIELATGSGPPDPGLSWLAALGLRALADEAETARARREGSRLGSVGVAAGALVDAIERVAGDLAISVATEGGRGLALAGLIEAESARIRAVDDAGAWAANASTWEKLGRPFPAAYARFREASALLAARGPREQASDALAAAHAVARRLGAIPLLVEVERLARHARIELPSPSEVATRPADDERPEAHAPYHFTERELEVLTLVAGGWTNQQIADALFITRKTASVHVSNILGKLGVDSRVEAAAIAYRIGLGADAPPPPDTDPGRPG